MITLERYKHGVSVVSYMSMTLLLMGTHPNMKHKELREALTKFRFL